MHADIRADGVERITGWFIINFLCSKPVWISEYLFPNFDFFIYGLDKNVGQYKK